jgi:two-component system chemotaxis response regulator CheY
LVVSRRVTFVGESGVPVRVRCYSPPVSPPRVLLIDDSATARSLLRVFLMNEALSLFEASGARQGLELLAADPFSVVVADFNMPEMNGVELVRAIRRHPRTTVALVPVLLLTGEADPLLENQALTAGANAFLKKPVRPAVLQQTIKSLLAAAPSR